MPKNIELQASNNQVRIERNPPLSAEDAELIALGELDPDECEHDPSVPVGAWVVRCLNCGNRWTPPTTAADVPKNLWFLCPDFCNLSERVANRILREMDQGRRERDADLADACLSRLARIRRPKRAETWDRLNLDPLTVLSDDMERRTEWHRRNSEWTPELNAAYDDFD